MLATNDRIQAGVNDIVATTLELDSGRTGPAHVNNDTWRSQRDRGIVLLDEQGN